MEKSLISILMPVHNDQDTLEGCLNSIWSQTYPHFEVMVVDDGSTDATPAILTEHRQKDTRLKVVRTRHQGIVSALNEGIEHSSGVFIARMDGDDLMLPHRLEQQITFMNQNPDIDLSGCLTEGFTNEGRPSRSQQEYQEWNNSLVTHDDIISEIFVESPIIHPTFFGKRVLFSQFKYVDIPWAEDYDFILRAYYEGCRFGKIPQVLVRKRFTPTQLSKTNWQYKRPAMYRAKVHYLVKNGLLKNKRGVLIAGTGPTGREIASAFQEKQVLVAGFVDNKPGPPDRKVMGFPAWGFDGSVPESFLESFRDTVVIIGVGSAQGRENLLYTLQKADFVNGKDFIRLI